MGKIRVSTLGGEEEKKLRDKQKIRLEEKKKRIKAEKVHISGMKGGQRVKSVGAESEEEIEKMAALAEEVEKDQKEGIKVDKVQEKQARKAKKRVRSKRYQEQLMKVDRNKQYKIEDALELLRQISLTTFDPAVELHVNTIEKGLRGITFLPHGTGKKITIAIADANTIDKIVQDVETGKINFDALIAHPQVMSKLARVAKFLGPKGLMPNPKAGTISATPETVAKKLEKGEINWKTEAEFPIVHQVIGKLSYKDDQLTENFQAFIKSMGTTKIKNITIKTTMSPAIKVLTQ